MKPAKLFPVALSLVSPAEEVLEEEEEVIQHPAVQSVRRSVWSAPVWEPPKWTPARSHADDHKAIAPRGIPC